jgi:hypothetical protein
MLVLAMTLAAWRIVCGPRTQDRVLGLDTLYPDGMLAIVVHGMRTDSGLYFEAVLIIGMGDARHAADPRGLDRLFLCHRTTPGSTRPADRPVPHSAHARHPDPAWSSYRLP